MYFAPAPKHMIWLSVDYRQDLKCPIRLWKSLVGDTPSADCYKAHRSEKQGVLWLASYPVRCDWPNTSSVGWKCYAPYHVVMPCPGETRQTIKPIINKAFVAFSEDIITDYNDSYGLFTCCTATVCAADRDVLFWAMCSFPKCRTYISQVYSPSVNVRKPWKYVHFAVRSAWAFALRFSAKLHRLRSERAQPRACMPNRRSTMK